MRRLAHILLQISLLCCAAIVAGAAPLYHCELMRFIPEGSTITSINESGCVLGSGSDGREGSELFLWKSGTLTDCHAPEFDPTPVDVYPGRIHRDGSATATVHKRPTVEPSSLIYFDGHGNTRVLTTVTMRFVDSPRSAAFDEGDTKLVTQDFLLPNIDNDGDIPGITICRPPTGSSIPLRQGFIWSHGKKRSTGDLLPVMLNDRGDILGYTQDWHLCIVDKDLKMIRKLDLSTVNTDVVGFNDRREVLLNRSVGETAMFDLVPVFVREDGAVEKLDFVPKGMNDAGDVVGEQILREGLGAELGVLYRNGKDEYLTWMTDGHAAISSATAINNRGQIVAQDEGRYWVLLTPISTKAPR